MAKHLLLLSVAFALTLCSLIQADQQPPASPSPRYRTLKVAVNRKDVQVRTRGGFYSVVDEDMLLRQ